MAAAYPQLLLNPISPDAIPDDSAVSTQPQGQVDYLSHQWREEDVWRSWRNMTRQKNEIANGMRLENASWRTWWKQRNRLKTVEPETLNWLKDSDVTWLYGPLHTAVEWTPPPKPPPVPDSVDVPRKDGAQSTLNLDIGSTSSALNKKPILKHRSIGELLTSDLPSPLYTPMELSENDIELARENLKREETKPWDDEDRTVLANAGPPKRLALSGPPRRPSLNHTKSDTLIARLPRARDIRTTSPPRIQQHKSDDSVTTSATGGTNSSSNKRKHITFNTFVEQCIAIEKPKDSPEGSLRGYPEVLHEGTYDYAGYGQGVRGSYHYDDGGDSSVSGALFNDSTTSSDEDEDMQAPIEIRSRQRKIGVSPGRSSSSSSSASARSHGMTHRPSFLHIPSYASNGKQRSQHVTIAPIPPTMLKTGMKNAFGVGFDNDDEDGFLDSSAFVSERNVVASDTGDESVDLVYVPPADIHYPTSPSLSRQQSSSSLMDMNNNDMSRSQQVYRHREAFGNVQRSSKPPTPYYDQPMASSSYAQAIDDSDDYFGSADVGDEYIESSVARSGRTKKRGRRFSAGAGNALLRPEVREDDEDGYGNTVTRSHPAVTARVKRARTPSPEDHAADQSSPSSSSITRSVTSPVNIPRASSSSAISSVPSSSFLSPPETTTRTRGRSATRGSVSDRERSSSRGTVGTGTSSPLGSISPEGSSTGIGYGYSQASIYGINGRRNMVPDGPTSIMQAVIPSPVPEESEEEKARSRQPTPANSPVRPLPGSHMKAKSETPSQISYSTSSGSSASSSSSSSQTAVPTSSKGNGTITKSRSAPISPPPKGRTSFSESKYNAVAEPTSPTSPTLPELNGSITERTADVVSSTRSLLGSMWH